MTQAELVIQRLIAAGANVAAADSHGHSALHYAITAGNASACRLLIAAGASVDLQLPAPQQPSATAAQLPAARSSGAQGVSPLLLAAAQGHVHILQQLLAAGAHVDTLSSTGTTALHTATISDKAAAVQILLTNGADAAAVDRAGDTPMHLAARFGYSSVVQQLLASPGSGTAGSMGFFTAAPFAQQGWQHTSA